MNANQPSNPEEIDIIQFFSAIGDLFKKMGNGIKNLIKSLFYLGVDTLLYLKKHYIFLTTGLILGLIISFLIPKQQQSYYGKALLRTNYGSQVAVKEKIDLINDLIQKKDTQSIAHLLNITPSQAGQLSTFILEPVFNDVYLIDDYEEYLMSKDTVVYKFLEYKDYKSNIKNNEALNKYWLLTIKAKNAQAFNQINDKILAFFNRDEILQKRKDNFLEALRLHREKDYKSLKDIDSMRQVINKVMMTLAQNKSNGAANIVVSSDRIRGPEAPYNLFTERQKLLKDIEILSHKLNKYVDVVLMLNPLPESGIKVKSFIGNKHIKYAIYGFVIVLLMLLAKDFNNYLKAYEQRKKASQKV